MPELSSLRIESADNGYTVNCSYKVSKKKPSEMSDGELAKSMAICCSYESENLVARTKEEVLKIVSEKLEGSSDED